MNIQVSSNNALNKFELNPEPTEPSKPAEPEPSKPEPPEPLPAQNPYNENEDAKIFYNHWVQLYGTDIKPEDCEKKSFGKNKCTTTRIKKNIAIEYINTKLKPPLEYNDNEKFWGEAQLLYKSGQDQYD